jgi:hypothetical protein
VFTPVKRGFESLPNTNKFLVEENCLQKRAKNKLSSNTLNYLLNNLYYEELNSLPDNRNLVSELEKSFLILEQKIISYLCTYGNTKETDLITYGVQKLGISKEGMVKLIDEMVFTGRIERILHREIEPAVTYVKQGSPFPLELKLHAISDSLELSEATNQQIEKLKEILDKAEAIAKKRMKRKTNSID